MIPFKGTELFQQVEHAGYELPSDWSAYEPYETDINLSEVPESSIFKLRKTAYRRFYLSPKRMWRIFKLIPNKRTMVPFLAMLFAPSGWSFFWSRREEVVALVLGRHFSIESRM